MTIDLTRTVEARPYRMRNQIQHYEWGTHDDDAYIPKLLGIRPRPGVPYGELWMGAHPKAPSEIVLGDVTVSLDQWIAANPVALLGAEVANRFEGKLPFLFKVLSAGEALSIQAHPNKAQAKSLHARAPQHYPDDNHKPEISIALDALTALIGLKPFHEIVATLRRYPEISSFIGDHLSHRLAQAQFAPPHEQQGLLQEALTTLLAQAESKKLELSTAIDSLEQRLQSSQIAHDEAELLFLSLHPKYPDADVGLFFIFLLNLVHLGEGEGMYASAGVPHAYLKGNIIECMANSDNVVRVGLTNKYKDYQALIDIIKVEPKAVDILRMHSGSAETHYPTPAAEFRVSRILLHPGTAWQQSTGGKPEIFIITQGFLTISWATGQQNYRRGESIFIPALLTSYSLTSDQATEVFLATIP